MIPNDTPQTLEVSPNVQPVASFRITEATQARILVSLSDKMYTRKQLAVVREYSNNANDAHIVAGKPTSEVIITLPTNTSLVFKVRDFGAGLSKDQIRDVYCVLGESTKRNSAAQNGVLGYGCKAGFAEADSFTVTSWNGGEKAIYNCIKGDSQKPHSIIELYRAPSDEPTGIEVAVPVKQTNVYTFQREAVNFFKHWSELPTIQNMDDYHKDNMMKFRNTPAVLSGEGWSVRRKSDSSAEGVAFMGGVPYRIDWNVLNARMSVDTEKRVLFEILQNNDVTLSFEMGEVQFVDSREGLEYTEITINALMKRMDEIFIKIKDAFQSKFSDAKTIWDAKKIYNSIFCVGLLEVEKGEDNDSIEQIRILDGNLSRLEAGLHGQLKWNDLVIDSPYFRDINRFDNVNTSKVFSAGHTPSLPVMTTYRKKKKRAKAISPTSTTGSSILASDRVAVVINDMNAKTGQSLISRYLLLSENFRTVHFLSFANEEIRKAFYDEYQFESVPVHQMSELLGPAKKWNASNRVSRSYGGGGGGTRPMYYFDIASGCVDESEVPVSEIEEGSFYLEVGEGRRYARMVRLGDGYSLETPDDIINDLTALIEKLDLDIDKVYIINNQVKESKWFNEAVKSGEWIKFWDYVKEQIKSNNDIQSIVDSVAAHNSPLIMPRIREELRGKVIEPNSPINEYIQLMDTAPVYTGISTILQNLRLWNGLTAGIKPNPIYNEIVEKINSRYPFLPPLNYSYNSETVGRVLFYVNASDTYIELTKPIPAATVEVEVPA